MLNTVIKYTGFFLNFSVEHLEFSSKTEEKIHKKLEGSLTPETDLSPTAKDQVEMYAFLFLLLSGMLFSFSSHILTQVKLT